jgi:hypothetical protein
MNPKKASLKILKSSPSLLLLMIRTWMAEAADRLEKRRQKKRGRRWLRKIGNIQRKARKIMAENPENKSPESLVSPFPPEKEKSSSPSPSATGAPLSDDLAAAAEAELFDLCADAHEGAHALLQWKYPKLPELSEKQKKRLGKQLGKNIEKAGVKVAPGLGYGVALLATYAPLLKYMKAEPKPAPAKEKANDSDSGKAPDGKDDTAQVADLPIKS